MSSDEDAGSGAEAGVEDILMEAEQFEAVFQITHQLAELPADRLAEYGCNQADLDLLISVVRAVDRLETDGSPVRFVVTPGETRSPVLVSGNEIHADLPRRLARCWQPLAQLAVTALGPREVFLRTGYQPDEMADAVARLSPSVG